MDRIAVRGPDGETYPSPEQAINANLQDIANSLRVIANNLSEINEREKRNNP